MTQIWLITGSSRGLGRALAETVLAKGHKLVATARDPAQLSELAQRYGHSVRTLALDVTDASAAKRAVKEAVDAFGRLDVVVNNAGYANVNSIEDMAEDDFRQQIETNLFGVINVTRAALPLLRAQRSGHIIQISSIGGRRATPGIAAYQTAKWAAGGFSEVLAKEVAPFGIKVTVIEPGSMRTDWAGSSMHIDDIRSDYQPTVGMLTRMRDNSGSMGSDPHRVAEAIVRIAVEDKPPLRLLMGSDAVFLAGVSAAARAAEDAKWKALSVSTDYPGQQDFAETPMAKALSALETV